MRCTGVFDTSKSIRKFVWLKGFVRVSTEAEDSVLF